MCFYDYVDLYFFQWCPCFKSADYETIEVEGIEMRDISQHLGLLKTVEYGETVNFIPDISKGKVLKVYDWNTVVIASILNSEMSTNPTIYRFSIALFDIVPPTDDGEKQKMASLLSARILGKIVDIRNIRMEKRGRIVSDIFCDGEDVNKWLLANYVV
jgi:hypothetical protein